MAGIERLRRQLTFSNAISLIALFFALGGTVYAAAKIDGKTIRKGSIPANRIKPDSLAGAQINEASLGSVPTAGTVEEATTAREAERAATADRAATATKAETAASAARVDVVPEAEHAKRADTATQAENVDTLGGVAADKFLRRCERGAVRAAVSVFDAEDVAAAPQFAGFNCAGDRSVRVDRSGQGGEYIITLDGIEAGGRGRPAVLGSSFGDNGSVSVAPVGANATGPAFRVKVFSTSSEELLPKERFTVVFF